MLVVVTLLMATGCSNQKLATEPADALEANAKPPVLIQPNVEVGKVQKGMNQQQVEAAIGKPTKINGKWWYYQSRGLIVAFGENGVLFNIKCVPPFTGVTKEGIGIGSTREELIAAYGNPSEEKHFEGASSGAVYSATPVSGNGKKFDNLWFASLAISFDLQNDRVTSFIVHLDPR